MSTTEHDTIQVHVARSGRWWSISVPTMPTVFSQCRRLEQVDDYAREAIALALDSDLQAIGQLDVHVEPPDGLAELIAESDRAVAEAHAASARAAEARRYAAQALAASGYPTRDIGALLGLSHQRVSQLLTEAS